MVALAAEDRGVLHYRVSNETRQRVDDARVRSIIFNARRILADGGFGNRETQAIIATIEPYLRAGDPIDQEAVRKALRAKSFSEIEARELAGALAAR